MIDNKKKLRLGNELIDIFTNLPKSTNTAMSWLLLHKSMKEAIGLKENNITFNLMDFIDEYNIDYTRRYDLKKELIRDFKKLKNTQENEYLNNNGEKITETFYFFQKTKINHETLEVSVKLNEDIYESVSLIPDRNYFQYLKSEAIMIANKKMTATDMKVLMYLKSKSHNGKKSYVKIYIDDFYKILGQSRGVRFAVIKNRHIDPFIERALIHTNYRISYEIVKNKMNKRTIEYLIFDVDNRLEQANIIKSKIIKDQVNGTDIAQNYWEDNDLDKVLLGASTVDKKVKNEVNTRNEKNKSNIKKEKIVLTDENSLDDFNEFYLFGDKHE